MARPAFVYCGEGWYPHHRDKFFPNQGWMLREVFSSVLVNLCGVLIRLA